MIGPQSQRKTSESLGAGGVAHRRTSFDALERAVGVAAQAAERLAVGTERAHLERARAGQRVGRAAEARVVGAKRHLDAGS